MKSRTWRRAAVTAAVSLALVLTARITPTYAVAGGSDDSDRFLIGTHVNVGIQQNGAFGSVGNAPTGTHTRPSNGDSWGDGGTQLGFTYDNGDGWGVGEDIGDYFLPGSPFEGFILQVGTDIGQNTGNGSSDLGAGTWSACAGVCETWTMDASYNGVGLVQEYSIVNDFSLRMRVTVTNTSGGPLGDIYYERCVDPDNVRAAGGSFDTTNEVTDVISDDNIAIVSASANYNEVDTSLLLYSSNANARAHLGCERTPDTDWAGTTADITKSGPLDGDDDIGLTVKVGQVAAGASYTFDVFYGLNATAANLPETSTEWSPMSSMLAFAAALLAVAGVARAMKEQNA